MAPLIRIHTNGVATHRRKSERKSLSAQVPVVPRFGNLSSTATWVFCTFNPDSVFSFFFIFSPGGNAENGGVLVSVIGVVLDNS